MTEETKTEKKVETKKREPKKSTNKKVEKKMDSSIVQKYLKARIKRDAVDLEMSTLKDDVIKYLEANGGSAEYQNLKASLQFNSIYTYSEKIQHQEFDLKQAKQKEQEAGIAKCKKQQTLVVRKIK